MNKCILTERELQNEFVKSSLIRSYIRKNYKIFEEVEYPNLCDVIAYHWKCTISFELKLRDIKKVIEQAVRNKEECYDQSYIVIPHERYKKISRSQSEVIEQFDIGIILYDSNKKRPFFYKRKCSEMKLDYQEISALKYNNEFNRIRRKNFLYDKLIRGCHKEGEKKRKSYR